MIGLGRPAGGWAAYHVDAATLHQRTTHVGRLALTAAQAAGQFPRIELLCGFGVGRRLNTARGCVDEAIVPPPSDERPVPLAPPAGHNDKVHGAVFANGHVMRFRAGAVDRMPDEVVTGADAVVRAIETAGGRAFAAQADVSKSADVARLLAETDEPIHVESGVRDRRGGGPC